MHTETPVWTARREAIRERRGETIALHIGEHALSVGEVVALWRDDAAFRDFFIAELAATEYLAFFWEMPPVDDAVLSVPFECAVIGSAALAQMSADDAAFAEHFHGTELIAAFDNLGGDALLIAPRKIADAGCYGHIGAFVRIAPNAQRHALLECLARETEKRLSATRERFWISTAGLGVPWVHVRLDSRPKYYQYQRYAEMR
jgi:hypothetical protein